MEATNCKKELLIEIPFDDVRRTAEKLTGKYARKARIPGFRPGHAPTSLVVRHFGHDIREEVVQSLVPKFFENAVKEQKWSVVGHPHFEDLKYEDDQPLTCKATFEVMPEVELKQYKELEVEEEIPQLTDADVEKGIEEVRQHAATFEVVTDRPAADGDQLTINYKRIDPAAPSSRPAEARDVTIDLGGERTLPAFTENLRGARPGETREFEANYPEDIPQKSLAGKTFRYHIEVQSIKHKVVPAADDELAKSVSEFSTLEEFRNKLRQDLAERAKHRAEVAAKQKLVERLVELHQFPVPDTLVEARLDSKLERTMRGLYMQGIDPRQAQIDWRKLREDSRV